MIDPQTILEAVKKLLAAVPTGSQIILFGSYARGDAVEESDLDFLIVEPQLPNRRQEMVRLRQILRPMGIPVDVLVVSRQGFEGWKDAPGNVVSEAIRHGKVFTHAA